MKTRVLIVGQKPKREAELERDYGERARLSFFYRGNYHHLKALAARAERAVFTINGSNHVCSRILRNVLPADRISVVQGGTSLRAALDAIINEGEAHAKT